MSPGAGRRSRASRPILRERLESAVCMTARRRARRAKAAPRAEAPGRAGAGAAPSTSSASRTRRTAREAWRDALGGKGANLAEMTRLGHPGAAGLHHRHPGLPTSSRRAGGRVPKRGRCRRLAQGPARKVERDDGRALRPIRSAPLLVSVRSGAPVSMPGMMDTVLNLGSRPRTLDRPRGSAAGGRFAYDSYRRFVQMYGDVVLGVPHGRFEELPRERSRTSAVRSEDTDLTAADLAPLWRRVPGHRAGRTFGSAVSRRTRTSSSGAPWGRCSGPGSNERAVRYRRIHGIPDGLGTAVNVQAMVFGNMGGDCATGVAFTRDPSTGEKVFYGEYLENAQGEDVVAGSARPSRSTRPVVAARRRSRAALARAVDARSAYRELVRIYEAARAALPRHAGHRVHDPAGNACGCCRPAPASAPRRPPCASPWTWRKERLIRRDEALCRVDAGQLDRLLHPTLDAGGGARRGRNAACPRRPARRSGVVVFSADAAEARAKAGEKVILVRVETSPDDIHGMHAAEGVLTARGGMTSHAAVVARGMGKPCVVGCGEAARGRRRRARDARSAGARVGAEGDFHHARRLHRRGDGREPPDGHPGARRAPSRS